MENGVLIVKRILALSAVLVAVGLLFWGGLRGDRETRSLRFGNNPDLPTLTFYTSGLATTPQLALWHAVGKGDLLSHCNLEVKIWKNLDDLRGTLLAGKGDLWLGHTEGFVQAARRGAPVRLLAVTAWRKFYLVTRNPDRLRFAQSVGKTLAYAPTGSPAVPVLRSRFGESAIRFQPGEGRQIAMQLMKGDLEAAVLPEPMVSILERKVAGLRVGESLEALYGKQHQCEPRMPIAGLAIREGLEKEYPGLGGRILESLKAASHRVSMAPEEGVACLPEAFSEFVNRDVVLASLARDRIRVEGAREVKDELVRFLDTVMPKAPTDGELDDWLY